MWDRIEFGSWTIPAVIIAFVVTVAFFTWRVVKVLRMSKSKRDHAASLPLHDDDAPPSDHEDRLKPGT